MFLTLRRWMSPLLSRRNIELLLFHLCNPNNWLKQLLHLIYSHKWGLYWNWWQNYWSDVCIVSSREIAFIHSTFKKPNFQKYFTVSIFSPNCTDFILHRVNRGSDQWEAGAWLPTNERPAPGVVPMRGWSHRGRPIGERGQWLHYQSCYLLISVSNA